MPGAGPGLEPVYFVASYSSLLSLPRCSSDLNHIFTIICAFHSKIKSFIQFCFCIENVSTFSIAFINIMQMLQISINTIQYKKHCHDEYIKMLKKSHYGYETYLLFYFTSTGNCMMEISQCNNANTNIVLKTDFMCAQYMLNSFF